MYNKIRLGKGLIVLLAILVSTAVWAQSEEAQLKRAVDYIKKAEDYYAQAQYESSIKEYQFAAAIYRRLNKPELYGVCYNGVGNNYINLTRYKEAYSEFNRGLALFKELAARKKDLVLDSVVVADAFEGLGRFYMNVDVNFQKALNYHEEALRLRTAYLGEKHPKVALSYLFIGSCYRGFAIDSVKAKTADISNPIDLEYQYLHKALDLQRSTLGEVHHQVADTYQALGDFYYELKNDYQKGFEYHQKALDIRLKVFREDHPKIAASYSDLATYYRVMSMFETELEYLEKGLAIQQRILGNEHKDIAKSFFLLGNRYYASGDYEKALDFYERAVRTFIKLLNENSIEVGEVYVGIGLCYRGLDDPKNEFKYLQQALKIQKKIYGKRHFKIGQTLMEIGTYYGNRQEYDSLLQYYVDATEIWKRQLGEDNYYIAKAYDNLANAHRLRGESEKEFYYLNEALAKKLKSKGLPQQEYIRDAYDADLAVESSKKESVILGSQLFDSYVNLASFYKRKKDYRLALIYIQNALAAVCKELNNKSIDIYQNPSIRSLSYNIEWLIAIQEKGHLLLQLYYANKNQKDLDFAYKTYSDALTLIDTLRINFSSDGSKEQLTSRSIPVYEGAIDVLHAMYQSSKNPKYLYEAFDVMEKSKGFVLLQALQGIAARSFSGVPAELLAKEEYLRRNLAYYADFKNRDYKNQAQFDGAYFRTKQSYDSLISEIEKKYPKFYALKYQSTIIGLKEVQATILNSKNMLLEYFIGNDNIYVFKVTSEYQYFYKMPIPNDFERMVVSLRNTLTDYQLIAKDPKLAYKNFVVASHSFYKTFVMQFLTGTDKNIKELIIIPDGWLSYIPFELLLEEAVTNYNNIDYAGLPYLQQRFEINYNYSATLMWQNLQSKKIGNNRRCLGFAPTYANSSTSGASSELPWAEKELQAVKLIMGGDYYFGLDATKKTFGEIASKYGVVHLAMHGIVNLRHSHKSFLAFTKTGKMTEDDAALYAYEVHNMSLKADLVVLSACETGFGKVLRGEGVLSLARAFMYAGVPSVVTTLWKVNDYTSATLMTYFYKNLASGMTKPEALRKAKFLYLKQSDHISGHPAFWASFITIGNPNPIQYGWPMWAWILMTLGGLILFGVVAGMLISKRRKKKGVILKEEEDYPNNEIEEPKAESKQV